MLPLSRPCQLSPVRHSWRSAFVALTALAAATIAAACGATSTTSVGPTPQRCELSLNATPNPAPAAGGTISVAVTTTPECQWSATENVAWITQLTPANGQGEGRITLTTAANTTLTARQDNITVNGVNQIIRQDAGTCTPQLSALSTTVTAEARAVPVTLSLLPGCSWSAVSNTGFVTVAAPTSGSGNATITLNIAANAVAASRQGTVTIAGQTFTVSQGGANCVYSVSPMSDAFDFNGGPGSATVTSPEGCVWSASSSANFVTLTSGASGSGTGPVTYNVARNSSLQSRTGTLTIAGQSYSVFQDALVCDYTITPTSQNIAASGGTGTVSVSTNSGCNWGVTNNSPGVITVTGGGGGGNANGNVSFSVGANSSGNGRSGTLTIAGQVFTVSQEGVACTFSISPASQTVAAGGGNGTTTVSAPSGCGWTAESNNTGFITVTAGASGSGGGPVSFAVAANGNSQARTGTLTIAGQTFTVTQAGAACNLSISPSSATIPAAGGSGSITIAGAAGCAWVTSGVPAHVTIAANGTAPATVPFTVAANPPGGAARNVTITVAGQPFAVNQAASPCAFVVAPTSVNVAVTGGNGSATVTTTAGCTWAATSNNPTFITVTSGANGNGNGTTAFSVAANTGAARNGTVTIAGQVVTVVQAGCTFSISPTSRTHGNLTNLTGTVAVTTTAGCAWTAVSNNTAMINVSGGASGAGNGTVSYIVTPQLTGTRTGTMTIAGQTFTITQGP